MKPVVVDAKVLDRFFLCAKRQMATFTDFYDPASWTSFVDELKRKKEDVEIVAFGGAEGCERRMLGFFGPEGLSDPFPIVRLRISHNEKFNKMPRHQDYLGSILGLGFDRGRIGDIFLAAQLGYAEVFVCKDIAGYICTQLDKVGRVPVKVHEVHGDDGLHKAEDKEDQINVASMRLDVVAAAMFHLSRGQVAGLIGAEKVFINWAPCVDKGRLITEDDMVTVRGYGRCKVGEVLGGTKKGRLRVQIFRDSV